MQPEMIASWKENPYGSLTSENCWNISLVKSLQTDDLVPGGNTGNPVRASGPCKAELQWTSGPTNLLGG